METIQDTSFQNDVVPCDDRHFVNCHLQDCELRYDGGKLLFENTSLMHCTWTFGGSALRTLTLIRTFDLKIGFDFFDLTAEISPLPKLV